MPLYVYKCEYCENLSEFRMKMSDPQPCVCPKCEKENTLVKQISGSSGFRLEGGGWFSQGYTGGGPKKSSTGGDF